MSMALQSAGLLCARLLRAQHGGSMSVVTRQREVERAYSRDWRRHFAPRLRLAASFAHLAMRPAAGGLLVSLARTFPQFLTEGARLGGKVRCAADQQAFTVSIPGPGVSASPPTASCFATRPAGTPREEMT